LTQKQIDALALGRRKGKKVNRPIGLKYNIKVKNKGWFTSEKLKGNKINWKDGRSKKEGYIIIKMPNHPYCDVRGYVKEHRFIMEKHIGRHLLPTEIVHHINGEITDNRIENLELFSSISNHLKFHWKTTRRDK
jgi:hypothetical protein